MASDLPVWRWRGVSHRAVDRRRPTLTSSLTSSLVVRVTSHRCCCCCLVFTRNDLGIVSDSWRRSQWIDVKSQTTTDWLTCRTSLRLFLFSAVAGGSNASNVSAPISQSAASCRSVNIHGDSPLVEMGELLKYFASSIFRLPVITFFRKFNFLRQCSKQNKQAISKFSFPFEVIGCLISHYNIVCSVTYLMCWMYFAVVWRIKK